MARGEIPSVRLQNRWLGQERVDAPGTDDHDAAGRFAFLWRDTDVGPAYEAEGGAQYVAGDDGRVLAAHDTAVSMSREKDGWDMTPIDLPNGTLKTECVQGIHISPGHRRAEIERPDGLA